MEKTNAQEPLAVGADVPPGQRTEPNAVVPPNAAPTAVECHASSPPAAATVASGTVTEETLRLREQLSARESEIEELRRQVKDREITVCEYQDKLRTLAEPQKVPVRKRAPESQPFLIGRFRLKPTR